MTEVEIKHRDRILEAIDQLRRRKARPDSPRICNYMMRRFSVDCKDTKSDLEKCIEKKIVIKVEYKGDISYRNAAKWNHKHKPGDVIETTPDSEKNIVYFLNTLNTAISELIFQEPDYLELGIPGPELMRTILLKSNIKYSKKQLFALIQKEVDNGGLIKLENGNFSVGSMPMEAEKSDDDFIMPDEINVDCSPNDRTVDVSRNLVPQKIRKKPGPKPGRKKIFSKENMTTDKSFGNSMGYRVGGRKKLAKKVFDPSDNNLPKRKRGRPVGSLNRSTLEKQARRSPPRPASVTSNSNKIDLPTGGVCSVCHQLKKGFNEKLISCRDCINKAHISCLHSEDGMLRLLPDNTWQCPHCKTCVTCFETSDAGILTVCNICSDAYHSDCHDPKIIDTGISKWLCYHCRTPNDLIPNEIKPKIENSDFDEKIHNGSVSPAHSENANQFQPDRSPSLPPALSPQANRIVDDMSNCSSNEYKFNISMSGNEDISGSRKSSEFTEDNYDPNIPDATNWTYEEVFHYFDQYFPNEACVFREQEIDGHSLLLMKRTDVLSSLNLKLGPALKIYRHVLKLQVRRDDPKLGWF